MANTAYAVAAVFVLKDQFTSVLKNISSHLGNYKREAESASASTRAMGRDFSEAGRYAKVAIGALTAFAAAVESVRGAVRDDVELKIAVTYRGDDPVMVRDKFQSLADQVRDVSRLTGGDRGAIKQGVTKSLAYVGEDFAKRGGLKYGTLLEDQVGITPGSGTGMKAIKRQLDQWQMPATEANVAATADMLQRYFRASGMPSFEAFDAQLAAAGNALSKLGAHQEEAAALLTALSKVKPEGAGEAFKGYMAGLADPTRRAMAEGAGLKLFNKDGTLKDTAGQAEAFAAFEARQKDPARRARLLMQTFGESGIEVADMFKKINVVALQQETGGRVSLEDANERRAATAGVQKTARLQELSEAWKNVMTPGEQWMGKALKKAGAVTGWIEGASGNEAVQQTASGAALLVGAGALAAGVFHMARGGVAGIKGLLSGGADTAAGVAKGLALEKATGVQAVYVTNAKEIGAGVGGSVGKMLDAGDSGARDVAFGAGSEGAKKAASGLFKTIGTIGSGPALTGAAGLVATGAVVAAGAAAIYGTAKTASEAQEAANAAAKAQSHTGEQLQSHNMVALLTANMQKRAKTQGWSEEEYAARLEAAIKNFQASMKDKPQYEGFVDNWWNGMKEIGGSIRDTAAPVFDAFGDKMDEVGRRMERAATSMMKDIVVRVETTTGKTTVERGA